MVDIHEATRTHILYSKQPDRAVISVTVADNATRVSLRARADALPALSKALGLALPTKPKSTNSKGARSALWIGPDEWLIIDDVESSVLDDLRKVNQLHSAVDISHRNVGIVVSGKRANSVINGGCPQDLSLRVFPVGAASRTVLGKVEIVLWRRGEDEFRVECWRSFAEYAFAFLNDAARDN